MSKNKVPEICFNGFSKELVETRLGDICTIGDIDHRMPKSVLEGIPYLMTGDFIDNNGLDFKNCKFISIEDYEQLSRKIKPEVNDILFARYASVGDVRYVETNIKFLISYSCAIIKCNKDIVGRFLFYYLQSNRIQYQIEININTGSQRNIGIDSLKKLTIFIPKIEEQIKIGNYFQHLDIFIEKKEKKYQKLKQFKKAMLDKMFPKNGADTPEIRFKGFSGKWEEKKLGQLAKITTGSSNRQDSGLDGKYTFFDRSDDIRTSNIYLFDGEAVIVAGEGSDFVPKYFKGKFDLHQRTYAIMNFENGDSKFLFYYIHLFRKWFLNQAVGSTVKSLRLPMFQEMVIKYPRKEEQEKIGNYFQKLDNQIDLQQKELEKLKNIKKASLSKMFV